MNTEAPRLSTLTADQLTHAKSLDFCRFVSCLAAQDGQPLTASRLFAQRFPRSLSLDLIQKSAITAGTTQDATWASPLVRIKPLVDAFLEIARPASIIGKIQGMRQVPFNTAVPAQTGGGSYGWVGEGFAKPATKLAFSTVTLAMAKCAGIIVLTDELLRLSQPNTEPLLRDQMVKGVGAFLDVQFTDPSVAAVANTSPASITFGLTPIVSSGPSTTNARTDILALIASFVGANANLETAVLLLSPANALALAATGNYLGLGVNGGTAFGLPVITSAALGGLIILLDPSGIVFADGGFELDVSREASLQLDSAPVTPAVDSTVLVNLWQNNLIGLRCERFVNWKIARPGSVAYVSGATYA